MYYVSNTKYEIPISSPVIRHYGGFFLLYEFMEIVTKL